MVPDKWKDVVLVNSKNSSTGVPWDMTRESADPESGGVCPYMTTGDYPDSCNGLNYGVTMIDFSSPTTDPRPISITFPDYTLQVSIKYLSFLLTTQCDVTVKNAAAVWMYWFVEWGYSAGVGSDTMKIVCQNVSHPA